MQTDDPDLILAQTLGTPQLAAALRAQARGSYRAEAAVELLIRHGDPWGQGWLDREDFRSYIWVGPSLSHPEILMAAIEWDRLSDADLAGSSSALAMLGIARAIAGEVTCVEPLSLAGLDDTNRVLALRAMLHTAGGTTAQPVLVQTFPQDES